MTRYWAKVEGGIVTNVIVAEQDFIDSHPAFGGSFVETFKDEKISPMMRSFQRCTTKIHPMGKSLKDGLIYAKRKET